MINDILIWVAIVLLLIIEIKNIRRINWCKNMMDLFVMQCIIRELEEEQEENNEERA